jgi:hypothetical protein
MSKTKQKTKMASAKINAPKIEITASMRNLIRNQTAVIHAVLEGSVRVRAERWHGHTSVYDTHRVANYMDRLVGADQIDMAKFKSLSKEIPTFLKMIGPNLSRAVASAAKA